MIEQEIVNYLKENLNKGVAFGFMPEEVKDWCEIHPSNIFRVFTQYDGKENKNGMWKTISNENYEMVSDDIICLPDNYTLPQKPSGEWVEFEIRNGFFKYLDWSFQWFDWGDFLKFIFERKFSQNNKDFGYFTAFGGWQYENSDSWLMTPRLAVTSPYLAIYQDNYNPNNYAECERKECKPAIPVKIRFWKGE